MKKLFLFLLISCVPSFAGLNGVLGFPAAQGGSIYYIQQPIGASLIVGNNSGSSLTLVSINPQAWVTNTGSSTVSWSPPQFDLHQNGGIVPPYTDRNGGSLFFKYPAIFHAPSINPSYSGSSLVPVGTQTYSISVLINGNDGTSNSVTSVVTEIDPLPLPSAQVTGVVK